MSTQTVQIQLTQREQSALTDVYGRAGVMVRTLASMQQGFTSRVPQVKSFQESWNRNIDVLRGWVGSGATGMLAEILSNGLVEDGRYGAKTATALGELVYLISEDYDDAANSVPIVASNMPVWYAQYHSLIEGALTTNFSVVSQPQDVDVSVDADQLGQQVLEDESENTAQIPQDDSGTDITFDEPTTIVSSARRAGWNVPIWAIGLGLVTAGTLIFFVAKKTRRRGSAAA